MRIKKNRKGDIATIIISLILVLLVLVAIPAYKTLVNTNSANTEKGKNTFTSFKDDTRDFYNKNNTASGTTTLPFN